MIRGNCVLHGGFVSGETAFIERTLISIENSTVAQIGDWALYGCKFLMKASFSAAASVGQYAFSNCTGLNNVSFPNVTTLNYGAFSKDTHLAAATFPVLTYIAGAVFSGCSRLVALYLPSNTVCELFNTNAFNNTPIGGDISVSGEYGYVYVPSDLYNNYIAASGWSSLASRIVAYNFGS